MPDVYPQSNAPYSYYDPYGVLTGQRPYSPPQQQENPAVQAPKPSYIYRPVGGLEEARAAQIEWDGTLYIFDDKKGNLYTKQYTNEGIVFKGFAQYEIPEPKQIEYASMEVVAALAAQIDTLTKELSSYKPQAKNTKDKE